MENIIIIGASGQAKAVIDVIEKQGKYNILCLLDNDPKRIGLNILGYTVCNEEDVSFRAVNTGIVAIGDNYRRYVVTNKIVKRNADFKFIKAIHPGATIGKNVEIGSGTVIMGGVVINSDTTIGEHCVINSRCSVDHDNKIHNYSTLSPGVTLGGNVTIGKLTNISLGANVIHGITIGDGVVIGAGSTVIRNIPDNMLAYGLPAKIVRRRELDEKYL